MFQRLIVLSLLAASSCFAQTFTASTKVENPPYGLVAQLWNNTQATIYLDRVDVSAAIDLLATSKAIDATHPTANMNGLVEFGIGYSHLEETQCVPAERTRLSMAENGITELSAEENARVFGALLAIATERLAAGSRILFAPADPSGDQRKQVQPDLIGDQASASPISA